MKKLICTLLSCSAFLQYSSATEAKLVMLSCSAGIPESVEFADKPFGYEYGTKLTFFIEGENFIRFDKKSLKAKGWELGSFQKVSKDGSNANFTITSKTNYLNKLDQIKVEGSITALTSAAIETKNVKINNKTATKVGDFEIKVKINKDNNWGNGVEVKGAVNNIKSVKLNSSGKKSNSSSSMNNSKTFFFKEIKETDEITVEYWTKVEEKVITFKK